jgi:uncharacterized cupin superfamily protein
MRLSTQILVLLTSLLAISVASADAPKPAAHVLKPVRITAADAAGPVFQSKSAVHENGADGPATDVSLLKSRDGRMEAGLYSAGPSDQPIESYEVDEFMYFLEGGVTLTSADGSVLEVHAGEGVAIPKGWKGRWTTKGYHKYYVTYQSGPKAK